MTPSLNPLKRARTPNHHPDDGPAPGPNSSRPADADVNIFEERRHARMKDAYSRSERVISGMFTPPSTASTQAQFEKRAANAKGDNAKLSLQSTPLPPKKSARTIDEDDYGDEDEEDEETPITAPSSNGGATEVRPRESASQSKNLTVPKPIVGRSNSSSSNEQSKTSEDVRKQLEREKKASEDTAKESFLTTFYTLENDRDAMLEQQKLDELDRQVENEMTGRRSGNDPAGDGAAQAGLFSSGTLGASRLTLKYLIARIDAKRDEVKASDTSLRSLMSEVRKNRSKWASEDRVGQEELYEAAESVLDQLKAKTPHVTPFLQKVNKRDAPDYYKIISNPMDIGQMMKKLKGLSYGSKKEFVDDLNLIWANCLLYNKHPDNAFRKKAEHMRRESDKIIPLIPDIVIRNRAEAEAEERRTNLADLADSDDDDEPIVATRGRKAPSKKGMKGGATTRKAPKAIDEPRADSVSGAGALGLAANFKNDQLRADADSGTEGSQHATPPPGNASNTDVPMTDAPDATEIDGVGPSEMAAGAVEEPEEEDDEYKTWKQVTQKDRARVAAERHQLFRFDKINEDEAALLRNKAGMRRWARQQKRLTGDDKTGEGEEQLNDASANLNQGTTLAEGIDADNDNTLPDYYDPMAGIPEIEERLRWEEDNEGHVIDRKEECLRLVPRGDFLSKESALNARLEGNMKQMQDTRKIMAKIGIVKQMQLQAQTYQNQFTKYEPDPLVEQDINPHVVSDDGAIMSPWFQRAAMQRSIGKICYHAGFEDFQPSALEAFTDLAGDYFSRLVKTLAIYSEAPKVDAPVTAVEGKDTTANVNGPNILKPRFSEEEQILHTLQENDQSLDSITAYIEEDLVRTSSKLATHHERVKDYLAELLRPALDPTLAGADGAGAFADGSDSQFVAGDFAEDIDEDFFGFKELGLDREFGLTNLSVPLHLLQSRIHNTYQQPNAAVTTASGQTMENPVPYVALTEENLPQQIGLVQAFFQEKLSKNGSQPLVEDEDLPAKQRFPKPRLPPTGKISSPRKRPIREQQMMARKKRRLEIEAERERERERERGRDDVGKGSGGARTDINDMAPDDNSPTKMRKSAPKEGASSTDNDNANIGDDTPIGNTTPALSNGDAKPLANPLTNGVKLDAPHGETASKERDPEKAALSGATNGKSKGEDAEREKEKDILSPESMPIAAH